jgi:glutamine amidotransferase
MSVTIADLGFGNMGSVRAAFARLGAETIIASDAAAIAAAERLVLPGVGAARFAMERMESLGLTGLIRSFERPLLGICLGMQLMFDWSEEGDTQCLGLIPGKVRRLAGSQTRRVPHMGWTRLCVDREAHGLKDGDYLWFAHSYACDDGPDFFARANDGEVIPAAVKRGHLAGCQFHPERSGEAGARFLKEYLAR